MVKKNFSKNNTGFKCIYCGLEVPPHPTSSRDHCIKCLYGQHVDINPGDRANSCHGLLRPIGMKITTKKEQIVYECEKCKSRVYCLTAPDDDRESIINLFNKVYS